MERSDLVEIFETIQLMLRYLSKRNVVKTKQISSDFGMHIRTAQRYMKNLEKSGYVAKITDDNGRISWIVTARGRKIGEAI